VLSLTHAYLASSFERRLEIKNNCEELPTDRQPVFIEGEGGQSTGTGEGFKVPVEGPQRRSK